MSVESVKKFFEDNNLPLKVEETEGDTATVKTAAATWGVEEDQIAKTMGYKLKSGEYILILTKGGARVDNKKFKDKFKEKACPRPCTCPSNPWIELLSRRAPARERQMPYIKQHC